MPPDPEPRSGGLPRRDGEPAPVRVEVVRSGGFAGLIRRETVDASECPPDVAARLEQLVGEAVATPPPAAPVTGADRFVYEMTVVSSSSSMEVRLGESQLAGPWEALVREVLRRGAQRPAQP